MLSSITWQQYLLAAGTTSGLYYLALLLLYLREDIFHNLKGKLNRAGLPADQPIPTRVPIMGPAPTGASPLLSNADTILVAPQSPAIAEEESDDTVKAILQEMNPLLELATEADAEKEELLPLLRLVTARHGTSLQDHHREAVEHFLLAQERLPFTLTLEDLLSLWNKDTSQQ